jgi:hypothetical protein
VLSDTGPVEQINYTRLLCLLGRASDDGRAAGNAMAPAAGTLTNVAATGTEVHKGDEVARLNDTRRIRTCRFQVTVTVS